MEALNRILMTLKRHLKMMARRSILKIVSDDTERQKLQVTGYFDEVLDNIERFQNYGHTSVPPKNAEAILLAIGGDLEQMVAIAVEDKDIRPKDLLGGDNCFYHKEGHRLLLSKDGVATLTVKKFIIDAEDEIVFTTKRFGITATDHVSLATPTITSTATVITASSATFTGKEFTDGSVHLTKHKHKFTHGQPKTEGPEG